MPEAFQMRKDTRPTVVFLQHGYRVEVDAEFLAESTVRRAKKVIEDGDAFNVVATIIDDLMQGIAENWVSVSIIED